MTLLYSSPRLLDHDTGDHPERAERLRAVSQRIGAEARFSSLPRPEWAPATPGAIAAVHGDRYVQEIDALAASGGGRPDPDTVVGPLSMEVARLAAGAACDAVGRVVAGEDSSALCLVRPPGHHALADAAMGFCLLNHAAIAARAALDAHGLDRVLIVDWDVHHGNGTQDIFYREPRVGFFSAHRAPFYPGTGAADQTGAGPGLGATSNLPVAFGTPRADYLRRFAGQLQTMADHIRPQLVILSAGFDSHREDPIGSLGLETEDFAELTRLVRGVADTHAGGRVVSLLEGGYNPPVLAECVALHLSELMR
ncbi:Histone deacetylase-like amidohydrolase [Pirellulimonas nuda]|uniref:Histone deacetylase-like amidohydrolase n=1 Tax=Pirellulimonas nuda TaxID=2528009 RepID=A0A518DJD5_9BACT|nr:histone deacetylase [Pirellulimonas nuda]QDU91587.1 Histone deacetylase-like amidohydrolase [Pirellulimonas nuda]